MSPILSIAIPTYNRPEILYDNLPQIVFEAKKYSIPIYISDNSLNDETKKIVAELALSYDYIFYDRNLKDVGHDKNSLYSLQWPNSEYVWLLGDSLKIEPYVFKMLFDVIEKKQPDLIALNCVGRDLDYKSGTYDHMEVFNNLGWHLTLTGATIYSRDAIVSIDKNELLKNKNFPQLPLIFNYLVYQKKLYWVNEKLIEASKKKLGYWVKDAFSIFIDDLSFAIHGLSESYPNKNKRDLIIQHSLKTNLFGFKLMVILRSKKAYNLMVLIKYRNLLKNHSNLHYLILFFLATFPVFILNHTINTIKKFK
jgi:abequosyltransferase